MTNPTMASQWNLGNFKPLDMSEIPGYPRRMPARCGNWLPIFTSSDVDSVKEHMTNFWAFFHLHPISDDIEDLAMKLFSATFHDDARVWYDSLLDAKITSMDQIEEVFLKIWSVKERMYFLLNELSGIKNTKSETIGEFHTTFERMLQKISKGSHT
jgi:hypothetical protein